MKRNNDAEKLIALLSEYPAGVSKSKIMRECNIHSDSTFFDVLNIARTITGIEILENKSYKLISVCNGSDEKVKPVLPDDDELIALFTIKHILAAMTSDLLRNLFAPLKKRFDGLLNKMIKEPQSWQSRIRILDIHYRNIETGVFSLITMSIARKRAVSFEYTDSSGKATNRIVSPQQLVRYKDNWYLDALCHSAGELRIFSLDMIRNVHYKNTVYRTIDSSSLCEVFGTSYGIFSGKPTAKAIITFTGKAARYVKREQWHPQQIIKKINESTVQLQIPYNKPAELISMILYWGDEAKVVEPKELRDEIAAIITKMNQQYRNC